MYRTDSQTRRISAMTPARILDEANAETSARCDEDGEVRALHLAVDIEHPSLGDLALHLESPAGTRIKLMGQSFRPGTDAQLEFDSETHRGLAKLKGERARGEWRVSVTDLVPRDDGTLRAWTLEIDIR